MDDGRWRMTVHRPSSIVHRPAARKHVMRRLLPLMLVLLLILPACDGGSSPPTPVLPPPNGTADDTALPDETPLPTPTLAEELAMYAAAADVFFGEPEVRSLLRPDVLAQRTVYIQPTFEDT